MGVARGAGCGPCYDAGRTASATVADPNVWRRARYPFRGLAVQSHRSPGGVDCEASSMRRRRSDERPRRRRRSGRPALYSRAMRRLLDPRRARDARSPRAGASTAGGVRPRPVRILTGAADDPRSGGPGRRGQRGDQRPAVRVADDVRRGPPAPPGPRRVVAVRGRRPAGHLPPSAGPDVLGRQPAPAVRRRPELASAHRSGRTVAARRRSSSTSRAPRRTCVASPTRSRVGRRCAPTMRRATSTVDLVRPGDRLRRTSSRARPSGSCRPRVGGDPAALEPGPAFVASGGYVLTGASAASA